jgi:hypothetical protein
VAFDLPGCRFAVPEAGSEASQRLLPIRERALHVAPRPLCLLLPLGVLFGGGARTQFWKRLGQHGASSVHLLPLPRRPRAQFRCLLVGDHSGECVRTDPAKRDLRLLLD